MDFFFCSIEFVLYLIKKKKILVQKSKFVEELVVFIDITCNNMYDAIVMKTISRLVRLEQK
jgi:hypothetical protein